MTVPRIRRSFSTTLFVTGLALARVGPMPGAPPDGAAPDRPLELTVPAVGQPLHITLDAPRGGRGLKPESGWELVTAGGDHLPAQWLPGVADDGLPQPARPRLIASLPPAGSTAALRRYRLRPTGRPARARFALEDRHGTTLQVREGDHPVLAYNYGEMVGEHVPASDPRRRRACYIHPVWGLRGEVLTDDFPPDHYHHHGIFWAWPHVRVGDREYDLWSGNQIQQRFVRWLDRATGPVAAVVGVENGWFVGKKRVMIERVWIRVYRAAAARRAIDISLTWIPLDAPITLQGAAGKSYGGLTMRFRPRSPKDAVITTPDGSQDDDLLNTPLRWADLSGPFAPGGALSGATILVPKTHPDYPPTWLLRHYGAICVGWPGVDAKTFPPDRPVRLAYRVSLHDGPGEAAGIRQIYEAYLSEPRARWNE